MANFRILYVNGTAHIGGAEVSLFNLIKNLNKDSFAPVVAVPSEGQFVDKVRALNVDVNITGLMEFSRYKGPSFLKATFRLASLIKKEKVDLVHANSIYIAEQSLVAAKMAGVPCICHVRDLAPVLGAGRVRGLAFRKTEKIIAISEAVKRDLTEKLKVPGEKIVRIYNGVDTQEFHPGISGDAFRQEFNLGSKRLVGMVGRLSPEKGHEAFLKAGAPILRDRDEARLVIVGSSDLAPPDYRARLDTLIGQLGIREKVVFTGFREDLPRVMAALDVVVVPSMREPFGRVIVEALAMEKGVIASNSGAVPEILSHDCGVLVRSEDNVALKEAITGLLTNTARCKRLGRIGRGIVQEKFDIKKNVSEIEGLYRNAKTYRI